MSDKDCPLKFNENNEVDNAIRELEDITCLTLTEKEKTIFEYAWFESRLQEKFRKLGE